MTAAHLEPATSSQRGRNAFSSGIWVLVLSGLLGFRTGMVGFPDWQVAVETSQVLAGLVKYPAGNPFFIYHIKLWTILHQVIAPLLWLGVSEIRLSLILSGILGMLTFQALSMFVFALSGDVLIAVGAAVLIFFTRAAEYGAVYGLFLLGTENTYGIVGLSFCVLAVATIGAGYLKTGSMLLGVAPAVHPSLGVWTFAIAATALLPDLRSNRAIVRDAFRWFLAGCGITLVSLLVQLAFIYTTPHTSGTNTFSTGELTAFITFWDGHRKPVDITHNGVLLNFASLTVAATFLLAFREALPRAALFLLRFVVLSALVSIGLVFVSWIPPQHLPAALLIFMPGRVLNFDAFTYAAMLIGLLLMYRRLWSRALLLLLVIGLLTGDHSMLWDWLAAKRNWYMVSPVKPLQIVALITVGLILGATFERLRAVAHGSSNPRDERALRFAILTICLAVIVLSFGFSTPRAAIFHDRTNDVFFADVAAGQGLLLTAGDLHLIQLKTRRPVLLDGGGLDGVMYSLEALPEMERILREVYGIDLLHPPDEARGAGRIPPVANQKVWEAYSTNTWRQIGRTFHVTQVLTYPDWTLNLPVAAQSRRLLLYQIPQ